ncbi:MAG TPA: DUF6049 family protein [Actinomycetota bacterium]|nr:DUF6049 family protein [Actinomycetota bacterium]
MSSLSRGAAVMVAAGLTALMAPVGIDTPAFAEEATAVRLALLGQTSVAGPGQPFRIRVGAVNEGATPFDDLRLTVVVSSPTGSRSEYGEVLEGGGVLSPLFAETRRLEGSLPAREGRSFQTVELDVSGLAAQGASGLYPIGVELRSGFTTISTLRTALVFLTEPPKFPLHLSLGFVLDAPLAVRADGVLLDDTLERETSEGGRLHTVVAALAEYPIPVTLIVSPALIDHIRGMTDGYRIVRDGVEQDVPARAPPAVSAAALVQRLREVARRPLTQVVALPYGSPSIPALVEAGLDSDLAEQVARGRAVVGSFLGRPPSTAVFPPPGSALSDDAVETLARTLGGDGTAEPLLVDGATLLPPPELILTPPALAQVPAGDEATVLAVASDPGLSARGTSSETDPRVRAQQTFGELAAIYFEQPSVTRGVALVFGEDDRLDALFLRSLLRAISGATWLRPVPVNLVAAPPADQPPVQRTLADENSAGFSSRFLAELERTKDILVGYDSMTDQPAVADQIRRQLLLAESRHYLGRDGLAVTLLRSARQAVTAEFAKVHPPEGSPVTLTSRNGIIPVTIRNDAGYPVTVRLVLRSSRLQFIGGASREVTLDRPVQAFTFPVRTQTTGRFPIRVEVQTPAGDAITSSSIVVRSTAYNRIALVITIGAALFLALGWGRRLLPRRKP